MSDVRVVIDRYVVGVDGGASKTVALVGNSHGRILGRGETGPSNYHNIGVAAARKAIKDAVIQAQRQAGLSRTEPEIVVVALAAVDSAADRYVARRFVRNMRIARTSFVVHDSVAALYAATQGKPGVIVISGTGCVAAGISQKGEYVRVGGWGYLIDDEGSAFDIGRKALKKAFRMMDGRVRRTKLMSVLKRRFRVKMFSDILNVIYVNGMSVEQIARLAPLVAKAAKHDEICREMLNEAGTSLAELACTVARRLKMSRDSFPVATFGGSFKSGHYLLKPFVARIRKDCPHAHVVRLKIEPARGALLLAALELRSRDSRVTPFRTYRWLREAEN
jgi:glucosamine kinase